MLGRWLFNIFLLPLFYLISVLPFWILFRISDVLFLLTYYIVGYRKKVVTQNLRNAFPEKSETEILAIRREFYRHFCDLVVETLKLLTISEKTFRKHCVMLPADVDNFMRYLGNGQSLTAIAGHYCNWEWTGMVIQTYLNRQTIGVYHPLSNKNMDRLMIKLRSRFGGDLVPMKQLLKHVIMKKQQNKAVLVGLIADQSPPPESAYWTTFLNQDTPVFNGPEKIAKKFNYPAVYMSVKKIKRGYYKYSSEVLAPEPQKMGEGELSELHTKYLEEKIREQPAYWLWSHRRWKHKKPA